MTTREPPTDASEPLARAMALLDQMDAHEREQARLLADARDVLAKLVDVYSAAVRTAAT